MSLRSGNWSTLKFLDTLPPWFGAFYVAVCQHQEDYEINSTEEFLCWKLRNVFDEEAIEWASELRKEQINDLGRKDKNSATESQVDDRTTGG
jgi:hypothetical protein